MLLDTYAHVIDGTAIGTIDVEDEIVKARKVCAEGVQGG